MLARQKISKIPGQIQPFMSTAPHGLNVAIGMGIEKMMLQKK
jgi:hypothetical protein